MLLSLIGCLIIIPITSIGLLCLGSLIESLFSPTEHIHYECVCDEPPILSTQQAIILGVIFFAIIMAGLHFILQSLKLSPKERSVAFIMLLIANALACIIAIDILVTPPLMDGNLY